MATLTIKTFDVHAVVEEKGVFLTQQRNKVIGTVRAATIEEAQAEVRRLYADMSSAYPVGKLEND